MSIAHGPRSGGMNIAGRQFSNADLALGIGLIVGIISVFLPWYSASYNGSGFSGSTSVGAFVYWSGWLFFIVALIGLIFWVMRSFVPAVTIPQLPATDAVLYLIVGILMIVFALIWWLAAGGSNSVSGPGISAGVSFGLWIGLIAGIITAVGGFLKRQEPQTAATRPFGSHPGAGYGGYGGPGGTPPPPPPAAGI